MNTNALKAFAQGARKKLKEQIAAKLDYILKEDTAELRGKEEVQDKLLRLVGKKEKEALIDRVAYTWFNRFVALRFMDVNDYHPFHVKVVTPKAGENIPEILANAKAADISNELMSTTEKEKVLHILDNATGNPENEAYRLLLVAACNHLHRLFPFLFEGIDDYTELLLPNDLTSPHSIISDVVAGMDEEDCSEVEIIGWLYQFYISERKDEVSRAKGKGAKGKVAKEDIPAVTQLFTPRWIVEYMVQNTLGKLWMQNFPNSSLKEKMPYYIETEQEDDFLKISSPEELTLVDPACGSGHILVYAFELLTFIYEEEGYRRRDIAQLIIENNLYGYEIDERAGQLASLALYLKARSYDQGFFRRTCTSPHVWVYQDLELSDTELSSLFTELKLDRSEELRIDLEWMREATNLGSLYQPQATEGELNQVLTVIQNNRSKSLFTDVDHLTKLDVIIRQLLTLQKTYLTMVTNPPYLGGGDFNKALKDYVTQVYPDSKSDLCTCFIERSVCFVNKQGLMGLVTMESWMFLSSYEGLRNKVLDNLQINSLTHFGWHIMRIAFGTCSFILQRKRCSDDFKGVYSYMTIDNINKTIDRPYVFPVKDNGRYNTTNQSNFKSIPGCNIGYWASDKVISLFLSKNLGVNFITREGMATANNSRFIRSWFEVSLDGTKWYPYNKGGEFCRWYGNHELLVNWKDNGYEIRNNLDSTGRIRSHNYNGEYAFKEGITWTSLTSGLYSARISGKEFLFDSKGSKGFYHNNGKYILALLNTKVAQHFLNIIAPTLDYKVGDITLIPYIIEYNELVPLLVEQNISISKAEWDSRETSWDFKQNELIRQGKKRIQEAFQAYQVYWTEQFYTLHRNEEALNKEFIAIYGLEEELTPEVPLEQITLLKDEAPIKNGKLAFNAKEVMKQLVSYGVGCLMGRYSLDKEGLILASQGETLDDYYAKIGKSAEEVKLQPDVDGIIPVLEEEGFEDDLSEQFEEFLRASFGASELHDNLNYLQSCLGRASLREYLVKDFYKDHIKRYKKRPIYWMLSSPKGAFRALIYLHRYTPDTLNEVLNNYLHPYIQKLENQLQIQEEYLLTSSGAKRNQVTKSIDQLKAKLADCEVYSKDLYKLAVDRINLDLDDGVLVNYNKLGSVVEKVNGLNDTKKKAAVRKFDWIKAEEIR